MGRGRIYRLRNAIQPYAWGSRGAIAALQGRSESQRPEAELWMGAHPKAPSELMTPAGPEPLDAWIAADPEGALGAGVARRFGELPFLLKVLAAERPLSIQAHPNVQQAEAGFARENAAGVPLDATHRCYRDARAKPELICALTPFLALNRFREPEAIARRLARLELPRLAGVVRALRERPAAEGLALTLRTCLGLAGDARREVVDRARAMADRDGSDPASRWVVRLCDLHPEDSGILAPWLLNLVELRPGDAMFLGPGELHAYLDGVAIECMASSDNVLRGGLTSKHMDPDELLGVLGFQHGDVEVLRPKPVTSVESRYLTPASEFALSRIQLDGAHSFREAAGDGPEIWLCVDGDCRVRWNDDEPLAIERGESVFVPAAAPGLAVEGQARLFRARVGLSPRSGA